MSNLDRSPLYNGSIKSIGPRYCPSIEDKVVRFADKERHQIFIEPESADTDELYVQGMSSSLPVDVQIEMYHSVTGLENCKIMRYAYAIEYDCIDSTCLAPSLEYKGCKGLFLAGQLNGSSGYEEAAAQGIIAGINCAMHLDNRAPVVLGRDSSYIGVLIDDLVTKGTNEPYRMMTARAEHRLFLRQENADVRLTRIGREVGLVKDDRWQRYLQKEQELTAIRDTLKKSVGGARSQEFFAKEQLESPKVPANFEELLKRSDVTARALYEFFDEFKGFNLRYLQEVATEVKYAGYLQKQQTYSEKIKKLEQKPLPQDIDYSKIDGLRIEARQKLNKIRPQNLGQASRISGVSPADITVLLVYLARVQ